MSFLKLSNIIRALYAPDYPGGKVCGDHQEHRADHEKLGQCVMEVSRA
jgi:hypothetical protein